MLSFKEYANLNFEFFISEKIKAHFLYFFNLPNIFPGGGIFKNENALTLLMNNFNYRASELKKLQDSNDGSDIKFFLKELNNNTFFKAAYEDFRGGDRGVLTGKNKKYYNLIFYYLKLNNLPSGVSPINSDLSKQENIEESLKEIYAKELFKIANAINIGIPDSYNQSLISNNIVFSPAQLFKNFSFYSPYAGKAAQKTKEGIPSFKLDRSWSILDETIDNNLINIIDSV